MKTASLRSFTLGAFGALTVLGLGVMQSQQTAGRYQIYQVDVPKMMTKASGVDNYTITDETVSELWRLDTSAGTVEKWFETGYDSYISGAIGERTPADSISQDAIMLLANGLKFWSSNMDEGVNLDALMEVYGLIDKNFTRIFP